MKTTHSSFFILGYFIAILVWWFTLAFTGLTDSPFNLAFNYAYAMIPLFGGVLGFYKAHQWGLFRSSMGKALFFMSAGLLAWGLGQVIWSYYNFVLRVEVPYPSWADVIYIWSIPFWIIGILFLSTATGARYGLKTGYGKVVLAVVPTLATFLSYYFFISLSGGSDFSPANGYWKFFFDIAYPLSDLIIITFAVLVYGLSFKYLGGKYKLPVLITLSAFVLNYIADFGFSYRTTLETYYNGDWVDLCFAAALTTLSFGITSFYHPRTRSTHIYPLTAIPNTHEATLLCQIIRAQESIIGPVALEYARRVDGLVVGGDNTVQVTGPISDVLERLALSYKQIFGQAAVEACKEVVKRNSEWLPEANVPALLR